MTRSQALAFIGASSVLLWAVIVCLAVAAHAAESFNPYAFAWIDPANWATQQDASGVQKWTLIDPAARAYQRQAYQSGQFCVASFRRGNRNINLMIPNVSPECPRH